MEITMISATLALTISRALTRASTMCPRTVWHTTATLSWAKDCCRRSSRRRFCHEWLGNIEAVLDGRTPDYLVVHHMEPDHPLASPPLAERYPQAQIVVSMGAFRMMVTTLHRLSRSARWSSKRATCSTWAVTAQRLSVPSMRTGPRCCSLTRPPTRCFLVPGWLGKFANDIEDPEGWLARHAVTTASWASSASSCKPCL